MNLQKFFRGQRVKIVNQPSINLRDYAVGKEAIIEYSYSDVYSTNDVKSYSLLILGSRPTSMAWFREEDLKLINDNRNIGEKVLQTHKNIA